MRHAVYAGQFYSGDERRLRDEVADAFKGISGEKDAFGAILPHAGYMFSGPCAAAGCQRLIKPDVFLVLGFSHQGMGSAMSLSGTHWETPLGICRINKDLLKALEGIGAKVDESAHMSEHSIEVQLPFLQYMFGDIEFMPISVGQGCDFKKAGADIAGIAKGKRISILASTDFTHYGMNFGYFPFRDNVQENLEKLDMGAVEHILKLDSRGFLDYIEKTGATICGKNPVALLIEIMKNLGAKAEMVKYTNSGEITGDYSSSVSYVSVVFLPK